MKFTKLILYLVALMAMMYIAVFLTDLTQPEQKLISTESFWKPSYPPHTLSLKESPFRLNWILSQFFLPKQRFGSYMCVNDESIFIIGSLDRRQDASLIALYTDTGKEKWQIVDIKSPSVLTCDHQSVYLSTGHAGDIVAYNSEDGTRVWLTRLILQKSASRLANGDTHLFIETSVDNFYILDKSTGAIQRSLSARRGRTHFFVQDRMVYSHSNPVDLVAWNETTNNVAWRVSIEGGFLEIPLVVEDFIYIVSELGHVYAVNMVSGAVEWDTSPLPIENRSLSNIAVDGKFVYYLSFQSELIVLDRITGRQIASLEIPPNLRLLDNSAISSRPYYVFVSSDHTIFVHFGDSSQLFSLQFDPALVTP